MNKIIFIVFCVIFSGIFAQNYREVEVDWDITGDFPQGERVDPQIFNFNGKDARENMFAPGKYTLEIIHEGYLPVTEEVVIPPQKKTYFLQKVLISKKRKVHIDLKYDIAPQQGSAPCEIYLQAIAKDEVLNVSEGLLLKPNSYLFTIKKQGYYTLSVRKHVWPDERPFVIEDTLISRLVPLLFKISDSKSKNVIIRDIPSGTHLVVNNNDKIKPGKYHLLISNTNGQQNVRDINIYPSDKAFTVEEFAGEENGDTLQLLFSCKDEDENVQIPHEVLVNGQRLHGQIFSQGEKLNIVVKFKSHATYRSKVTFPTSVIHVPLQKLKLHEFAFRKKEIVIDEIVYPYTFWLDGQKIEEHLVHIEKGHGRYYFSVWGNPHATILDIETGYLRHRKNIHRIRTGMRVQVPNEIIMEKMIHHLQKIKSARGQIACVDAIKKLLRNFRLRRLLVKVNLQPLVVFVEGLRLYDSQQQQAKAIVKTLHELNR